MKHLLYKNQILIKLRMLLSYLLIPAYSTELITINQHPYTGGTKHD